MIFFLSFMNLFRNSRRTLAILLTIALGTGVLFSFKGFIHGVLTQYMENTVHAHYGHGQINTKGYRETTHAEPWKHWINHKHDLQNYLARQDVIEHVFPRVNFSALLKKGQVTVGGAGQGIEAPKESKFFHSLNIEEGENLTYQENGILLGKGLAKALGVKPGDAMTLVVNAIDGTISQTEMIVTGIFHTGSLDFDSRVFRIPLAKAQTLLRTGSIEMYSLGLKDFAAWEEFAASLEKTFPELEATSFAVLDQVYYQHSVDWLNAQFHVIQMIILSIVLLGIFNSISGAILERKQEIGNFRANGESIGDVMRLITLEGTFLGMFGSALGIVMTFILMKGFLEDGLLMPPGPGLTRPFYISFQFEWTMVYATIGLSTIAAMCASLMAGIRVARMPIAKALRAH